MKGRMHRLDYVARRTQLVVWGEHVESCCWSSPTANPDDDSNNVDRYVEENDRRTRTFSRSARYVLLYY